VSNTVFQKSTGFNEKQKLQLTKIYIF